LPSDAFYTHHPCIIKKYHTVIDHSQYHFPSTFGSFCQQYKLNAPVRYPRSSMRLHRVYSLHLKNYVIQNKRKKGNSYYLSLLLCFCQSRCWGGEGSSWRRAILVERTLSFLLLSHLLLARGGNGVNINAPAKRMF
jgi:hypothetical protein